MKIIMFSIKNYIFLVNQKCNYVCRRCLSSYTRQNVLTEHKRRSNQHEITSIKTSIASYFYWKKYLHKNPLYFRLHADFEADNHIKNSDIGEKQLIILSKAHYIIVII